MEKKNAFTITRARPEDAAALLDYLKIVGGETDNLSFGADGVLLAQEEEQAYLRTQVDSPDHVQYLARVDGELIGTASRSHSPASKSEERKSPSSRSDGNQRKFHSPQRETKRSLCIRSSVPAASGDW